MRAARLVAIGLVLCGSLAGDACAEDDPRVQIDKLLDESNSGSHPYELRARFGREALSRLQPLLAKSPGDAGLHYRAALGWLAAANEKGRLPPLAAEADKAARELDAVRRLDAIGAWEEDVAFSLALLRSAQGRFAESVAQYDCAIALHAIAGPYPGGRDPLESHPGRTALLYGNSAEALMALGRLGEAIARYRVAVELTPADQGGLASLPLWGLAVALDRDGQAARATQALRQALARDPKMADLDDGNVFFIPAGEKLYYQALGLIETGQAESAADALRRYLETNPSPRWAARARALLDEVTAPRGK